MATESPSNVVEIRLSSYRCNSPRIYSKLVQVMEAMDDRGTLRREQKEGEGEWSDLERFRLSDWTRGFLEKQKRTLLCYS